MSLIARKIQDGLRLNRPVPELLKKYDYLLVTFLFLLIFWVEEITDMHHSSGATGFLLLAILIGAVVTAVIFQRQTWCRHICPLGGMVGVCSLAAPLELRSNTEVCMNKCTSHSCYKGTDEAPGCPVFQHVPFIDNN
ncbi:4Fe-4S binding protein [Syntrophothermus sp.]|uniref:4Fe-4S binding protein n=1 Tax=Syntrophothermus sp. TaxID=2736299 RepID=UPI00338D4BB1